MIRIMKSMKAKALFSVLLAFAFVATSNAQCIASGGPGCTAPPIVTPGGRLTTESGVPISTTDRTAQGTLYYTPYVSNQIPSYSGVAWSIIGSGQISLSLSITSGKNYDVFVYNNSGTATLELSAAWASDTARTDALTTQDGVFVKSGATTRLWIGAIRASGTNVTADSIGGSSNQVGGQGYVCNAYNAVARPLKVVDTTASWTYTSTTIRQADAAAGNKVDSLFCTAATVVTATVDVAIEVDTNSGNDSRGAGVGIDSVTVYSGIVGTAYNDSAIQSVAMNIHGRFDGYPGLGYHYIAWLESGGAGDTVFYGVRNNVKSGLTVYTYR